MKTYTIKNDYITLELSEIGGEPLSIKREITSISGTEMRNIGAPARPCSSPPSADFAAENGVMELTPIPWELMALQDISR